jgi:hypothetical protein
MSRGWDVRVSLPVANLKRTMNLFHAAVYTNGFMPGQKQHEKLTDREKEIVCAIPNILESYHYVGTQRYVNEMRAQGAQVFLDSGAFSAHSLGVAVNIDEYCDYIIQNRDIIRHEDNVCMASVLDGIGDDLKTWQNQLYMESRGACPLPCFHFGEDPRYLEWYISRYPYITIGGLVGRANPDTIKWLDTIWNKYLLDGSGRPLLKVHAFGVTRIDLMERYPWWSVDSSSWIQYAVYGHIFFPEFGSLTASAKSPGRHDEGRHVTTLSPVHQQYILDRLAQEGFDYERIANVYEARAMFNCLSFQHLNVQLNQHFEKAAGVLDCHSVQGLF